VCRGVIFQQRVTDLVCLVKLWSASRPTASVRMSLCWKSLVLLFNVDTSESFRLDLSHSLLMHMNKSSWRLPLSNEWAGSLSQMMKDLSTSVHSGRHVGGVSAFTCHVHQFLDTSRFSRHNR